LPLDIRFEGDAGRHVIIPHLLIGFVENAFKHGDLKSDTNPLRLYLQCKEDEVHFRVENKIGHHQKDDGGGVGLQNIQRRLELAYAGSYTLQQQETDSYFSSQLTLKTKHRAYIDN
jgi:LytS/YehU family sensor histidine kinase